MDAATFCNLGSHLFACGCLLAPSYFARPAHFISVLVSSTSAAFLLAMSAAGPSGQAPPGGTISAAGFKRLARLIVRAFYNGPCPPKSYRDPGDTEGLRSKMGKVDTSGLGIILMDYLLAKEWVGEADIVEDIKVHHKLIRRALKYLEREQLLMSEHRRETRRSQKKDVVKAVMDAAAAAAADPDADEDGAEQLLRPHTISYYAVDFPKMFDAVQLRLHIMRKVLKDELDCKEVLAKYVCEGSWCKKEHDSLGVHWLMNPEDGELHCDICDSLVKRVLASGETGDENTRRQRREMIASRLERMEKQLHDITKAVTALRNSNPPFYGTLRDWAISQQAVQQRQQQAQAAQNRGGAGKSFTTTGGMPGVLASVAASTNYWEDTQVEVNLAGSSAGGDVAAGTSAAGASVATSSKAAGETKAVVPPWMLRPGATAGGDADTKGVGSADSKAAAVESEMEARQKAYVAAYMKAMMEKEQAKQLLQQQALAVNSSQEEPPAKRTKQEHASSEQAQQDVLPQLPADDGDDLEWAPIEATPAPVLLAASPAIAGDEDEWEDI